MAHTCNSSTLEAEAEKIAIQGQPGLQSQTVSKINKKC
jgi:hypothetical protein